MDYDKEPLNDNSSEGSSAMLFNRCTLNPSEVTIKIPKVTQQMREKWRKLDESDEVEDGVTDFNSFNLNQILDLSYFGSPATGAALTITDDKNHNRYYNTGKDHVTPQAQNAPITFKETNGKSF